MSTEQKAEAYDKALDKMKSMMKDFNEIIISRDDIEEIFPEMVDNDEKIRQTLINHFKSYRIWKVSNGVGKEDAIAWLEKQKPNEKAEPVWRPSKVQLDCLKEVCDKRFELDGLDPLYTLYEKLKTL